MNKPIAVLISDVHYNITTLEVADKAMRMAIAKANELDVPFVVCGDLHDTKANLRSECITAMTETFKKCETNAIVLRGNHCSLNEKSQETALTFLTPYVNRMINTPTSWLNTYFIPYYHDSNELRAYLKTIPRGSMLIMHQGIMGTTAGHYFQDKSALSKDDLAGFRVISGHYHTRQSFELPEGGRFDYVGNPYTLGFGEANDPEKGFQVLYDNGSLEFIPTNLRKHIIYDITYEQAIARQGHVMPGFNKGDLVWFKVRGTSDQLAKVDKKIFNSQCAFKLDLIPYDINSEAISNDITNLPQEQLLDNLIDSLSNTDEARKARLKLYYKQFLSGDK